jgi:hypothetical protein
MFSQFSCFGKISNSLPVEYFRLSYLSDRISPSQLPRSSITTSQSCSVDDSQSQSCSFDNFQSCSFDDSQSCSVDDFQSCSFDDSQSCSVDDFQSCSLDDLLFYCQERESSCSVVLHFALLKHGLSVQLTIPLLQALEPGIICSVN